MATPEPTAQGEGPDAARAAVTEANRAFYEAFEAADLDAMSDLWEHSDRTSCVHPGWTVLRGWGPISASWLALFQGPQRLQFILTDERVEVGSDVGWVTVDENIIGDEAGATVAALNVFVREGDRWKMVAHHGSAVLGRPPS
jgi:ketosteroid isomerase-like protein